MSITTCYFIEYCIQYLTKIQYFRATPMLPIIFKLFTESSVLKTTVMNDNTQENVFIFDAPDELWSDINECVAKVVLTGKGANFLPPDVFK